MYFDALTLAAVAQEIARRALGGRVQAVVQPDDLSIALEVYANQTRHDLIFSAEAAHPRVHFAGEKPRRGTETPSPLLLQLRKHLVGAHLVNLRQPAWERILELRFQRGDETLTLIAEIMGRHSNLILTDAAGKVLECVKRIGSDVNRYRVTLPGHPYVAPPVQNRMPLPEWDEALLAEALAKNAEIPPERVLVSLIRGLSPLAAREALARAGGADPARTLAALRELFAPLETGTWTPAVGLEDGVIVAYAPYALTHLPEYRSMPSVSAAIEAYRAARETADPYAAARASVRAAITEVRKVLGRRRGSLQRETVTEEGMNAFLEKGQMLLSHLSQVKKGEQTVTLPGWNGEPIRIDLNPKLSPVDNAQRFFKAYQKARAALEEVPAKLEELAAEEAYLAQLEADLSAAESRPEIDDVLSALAEAGYVRTEKPRPRAKTGGPLTFRSADGFAVLVGRNSRQNEELTFKIASPDDIWLHVRGRPGAHVVIRSGGREVPDATLRYAAQLAAWHSTARDEGSVQVGWTLRKHVRRMMGGRPGMVRYTREQSLLVEPAPPEQREPSEVSETSEG